MRRFCRRNNHSPQKGVKGASPADCVWALDKLPLEKTRETSERREWVGGLGGWADKKKRKKTEEEIKNFNRARGKYYTNQLHSAEIIDELSTLLVIN